MHGRFAQLKIYVGFLACVSLGILLTISFEPGTAQARDEISIGRLEMKPLLNVKETYTDNLFQNPTNKREDFITTITPAVSGELPIRRHLLTLDYRADLLAYSDFDEYNTQDQLFKLLFDMKFEKRWLLRLGNDVLKSSTPPEFPTDDRNNFYYNTSLAGVSYKLRDRYTVDLDYKHKLKRYDIQQDRFDDFDRDDIGTTLLYRQSAKTSLLFEYVFTNIDNEDFGNPSTDSESHTIYTGVVWSATSKTTGTLKGGYITRDYKEAGRDESNLGFYADLKYKYSESTTYSFRGTREFLETSITALQGPYGTNYVSTSGDLSMKHWFTSKVSTSVGALYRNDNYSEAGTVSQEREDNRYGGNAGLSYTTLNHLACGVQYSYTKNDSNISFEDFEENQGMVHVMYAY